MPPTRPIELARLNEDHTWDEQIVDIPATTHESKILEVAIAVANKQFGDAWWVLYNSYDDDVPEVPGAFIIEVQDNARCVQRFLVTGCTDEVEALEKMGEGDREQYGPDETLSWLGAGDDDYQVRSFNGQ